jgi:hypothetical protein
LDKNRIPQLDMEQWMCHGQNNPPSVVTCSFLTSTAGVTIRAYGGVSPDGVTRNPGVQRSENKGFTTKFHYNTKTSLKSIFIFIRHWFTHSKIFQIFNVRIKTKNNSLNELFLLLSLNHLLVFKVLFCIRYTVWNVIFISRYVPSNMWISYHCKVKESSP